MLVEDTVHSAVDRAPADQRGARRHHPRRGPDPAQRRHARLLAGAGRALPRARRRAADRPAASHGVDGRRRGLSVDDPRGELRARQVVSAVPATDHGGHLRRAPPVARAAAALPATATRTPWAARSWSSSACPRPRSPGRQFTHHQLLQDYDRPLGDGNNMFVSVSAPGDPLSAPPGHRAVMISTHTDLADWDDLGPAEYEQRKKEIGERLIAHARRVYPRLGRTRRGRQIGTPRSYERFTLPPARRGRRRAADACATPTSSRSRTTSAGPGCGWSATRPGRASARSPACWAAASSPRTCWDADAPDAVGRTWRRELRSCRCPSPSCSARTCSSPRDGSGSSRWPGRTPECWSSRGRGVARLVVADAPGRVRDLRRGRDRDPRRGAPHARPVATGRPTGRCSRWAWCCWRAATPTGATHLQHHRLFPHPDDPEGYPGRT